MNALTTTQQDLTRKDAEKVVAFYKAISALRRHALLWLFEGKAHKAYNFSSFEEFAEVVLNITSGQSYISEMIGWARVDRNVLGIGFERNIVDGQVDKILSMDNILEHKTPIQSITRRIYRELSRLNDYPEAQREAYKEFRGLAEIGRAHV